MFTRLDVAYAPEFWLRGILNRAGGHAGRPGEKAARPSEGANGPQRPMDGSRGSLLAMFAAGMKDGACLRNGDGVSWRATTKRSASP